MLHFSLSPCSYGYRLLFTIRIFGVATNTPNGSQASRPIQSTLPWVYLIWSINETIIFDQCLWVSDGFWLRAKIQSTPIISRATLLFLFRRIMTDYDWEINHMVYFKTCECRLNLCSGIFSNDDKKSCSHILLEKRVVILDVDRSYSFRQNFDV